MVPGPENASPRAQVLASGRRTPREEALWPRVAQTGRRPCWPRCRPCVTRTGWQGGASATEPRRPGSAPPPEALGPPGPAAGGRLQEGGRRRAQPAQGRGCSGEGRSGEGVLGGLLGGGGWRWARGGRAGRGRDGGGRALGRKGPSVAGLSPQQAQLFWLEGDGDAHSPPGTGVQGARGFPSPGRRVLHYLWSLPRIYGCRGYICIWRSQKPGIKPDAEETG